MFTTPYTTRDKLLQGRVDATDHRFLVSKLPYTFGLTDIVVATLFKSFINELRKIHESEPIPTATYVDDPTYILIERVLSQCNFSGGHVGQESRPDGERGTDAIRPEVQPDEVVGAEPQGRTPRRRTSKAKKGTKEVRG